MKLLSVLICVLIFALPSFAQQKARKIFEGDFLSCADYLVKMDQFLWELKSSPNSKGYILIYNGKTKKQLFDKNDKYIGEKYVPPQSGLFRKQIGVMKDYINYRGIYLEDIIFAKGAFQERFAVELWIIPNGVALPKPKPSSAKIKYGNGKPFSLCVGP